jgi:hypothetical protein
MVRQKIEIEEGACNEVQVRRAFGREMEEWREVLCVTHWWECGHKHTRWGPAIRCLTRHVAEYS